MAVNQITVSRQGEHVGGVPAGKAMPLQVSGVSAPFLDAGTHMFQPRWSSREVRIDNPDLLERDGRGNAFVVSVARASA